MDSQPQRRIADRYRLLEPIGQGGMGVVWKAHDELIDRVVAVKEVLHQAIREEDRERFNQRTIREARAAGRLSHPNVVVVHDVIEEDGRPWIVMQLVHARSLGDVLKTSGPLPPERVAAIGAQVLDALRTAHQAGVLHRDVKPENVLIGDDGRVVLTDFGIATMTQETALTMSGQITGTPAFMPPERLNGLPAVPESDLWSLGATLYAAVEGHPPFDRGAPVPTMAAILHEQPRPTRRAGPLTPVIEGLLRKDPAERMDARQADEILRRVAAGGSSAASPSEGHGGPGPGAGRFGPGDSGAGRATADAFGSGGPGPGGYDPGAYGSGAYGSDSAASHPSGPSHPQGPAPGYAAAGAGHVPPSADFSHMPTGPGMGGHGAAGVRGTLPDQWSQPPRSPGHDPGQAWGSPPPGPSGQTTPTYPEGHPGFHPAKRSRGGLIALTVAVPSLIVAGGAVWYALTSAGGGTPGPTTSAAITTPGATDSTPPPSPAPESPTPSPSPSPTPTADPTEDKVTAPPGWRLHKDRGGFTIALPRGWTEFLRSPTSVKFHGPGSTGYLQIDWTEAEEPILDPVAAWEDLERRVQEEGKFPDYRRLRIEQQRFLGQEAADWEFTWRLPSGTIAHVLNRGFRTENGKPFAVYWQTRDSDWDRDTRFLRAFLNTFRPS
ncbi:protein kinase [Thermopolyspora sp. NPDC052614]|uniref:serine/threonine-protein kinase n=1 Tax=Thermopolyspora sp. NPDC052614 TaxID=3155682 RepID=UPI00343A5949